MKMIVAIIRPERLEAVQIALGEKEVYLMTASDVRGCGRQRGYTEQFRGGSGMIRLLSIAPRRKNKTATTSSSDIPSDFGFSSLS